MSRPSHRILALCLAASLVLHVLVLFLWPAPRDRTWSRPPPLEVALLRTEPPRIVAPQPLPAPVARPAPPRPPPAQQKRAAPRHPPPKPRPSEPLRVIPADRPPRSAPPRASPVETPPPPSSAPPQTAAIERAPPLLTEAKPIEPSVSEPTSVPAQAPLSLHAPAPSSAPPQKPESGGPTGEALPASPARPGALPLPPARGDTSPGEQVARAAPPGGLEKGPTLTPPSFNAAYLRNPPPRYPVVARRNGEEGTVTLRVRVSAGGRAASVSIESSSGSPSLDRAALDAVRAWRFVPARSGTENVEAWVLVPIVFRLDGVS